MSATTLDVSPHRTMPRRRLLGVYLQEARSECLRYMRQPAFILPLLLFPGMFYVLFGVLMAPSDGAGVSRYLLASYSVFGVMSPGLFGFGVSLAVERDGGLLTYKRALPMPPAAYLLGKTVMAMAAAAVVVMLLLVLSALLGHVSLAPGRWLGLVVVGMLGVLPFCTLGMWVGTLFKGQAAPGLLNLVYLPMAFLSGLWLPLSMLPALVRRIAPVWPSYHLNAIALDVAGMKSTAWLPHVVVLAGFSLLFLGLAARRLRRHG